jgi:hypothetical protein
LGSLEAPFVKVLAELPNYLKIARENPRARARLAPPPYDADAENEEWRRHAGPEISHLFESAAELVTRDLARLEREGAARTYRVAIPAAHHTAWMSTLNAARLAIGEAFRLHEEDLHPGKPFDPASERDEAILNVNLLGWLEELLVQAA